MKIVISSMPKRNREPRRLAPPLDQNRIRSPDPFKKLGGTRPPDAFSIDANQSRPQSLNMESHHPRRLDHTVPPWVKSASIFHIRIRTSRPWSESLIEGMLTQTLLDSVSIYQRQNTWNCHLFLLMPDHLHALLSFNPSKSMSRIIGNWKSYHAKTLGIQWQDNYFDHRIRNEKERSLKYSYILNNPVAKGLCPSIDQWPWKIEKPLQ